MQVKVSLHVFGSIRGYATLAKTDDITAEECVQLESFSFGQTGDSSYIDSLEKKPAIISRPLDSGRWAITRVLKGNPDDYNRQTMLFITAIISSHDWLDVLRCDVMPLLDYQQLWQFTPDKKLNPVNINVSSERPVPSSEVREKVIPILCTIEKLSSGEKITVLLDEKQYDIQVLRWLNMVLPRNYKKKFSYALRSLSDGIDVDIISLSPIASVGNSTRKVTRLKESPSLENSVYSSMINKFWKKEGVPSWRFIDNCPNFNILQELPTTSKQPLISYHSKSIARRSPVSHRSIALATKAFFVLLVMAIIGTACYFVIDKIIVKKNVEQKIGVLIAESSTFLDTHKDQNLLAVNGQLVESIADCRSLIFQIDDVTAVKADVQLTAKKGELQKWLDNATNFQLKYNAIRQLIFECDNANLSKFPDIYPDPNNVQHILDLIQRCTKSLDDALPLRNDFENITTNIVKINSWLSHIKKLIDDESKNYKTVASQLPPAPECFEEKMLETYKDVQKKLADIKNNKNLINASESPIGEHRKDAKTILSDINDVNDKRIVPDIKKMNKFKSESIEICNDANSLIEKLSPDIKDINDVNEIYQKINDVNEIYQKLNEAKNKWPTDPNIGVLSGKLNERFASTADYIRQVKGSYRLSQILEYFENIIFEGNVKLKIRRNEIVEILKFRQDVFTLIEKLDPNVKDIDNVNKIYQQIKDVNEIHQKVNEAKNKKKWLKNPPTIGISEELNIKFSSITENILKVKSVVIIRNIKKCLEEYGLKDNNELDEKLKFREAFYLNLKTLNNRVDKNNYLIEIPRKIQVFIQQYNLLNDKKKEWPKDTSMTNLYEELNIYFSVIREDINKVTNVVLLNYILNSFKEISFENDTDLEKKRKDLLETLMNIQKEMEGQ